MVEAIRYTQAPLYSEKSHVITIAMHELIQNIGQVTDSNSISSHIAAYKSTIQDFLDGKIDYHTALQQLQPLQQITHVHADHDITTYNAIVSIINALSHHSNHTNILQQLCKRLQDLTQVQGQMEEPVVEYL